VTDDVPGIRRMLGAQRSSHATATCAVVALRSLAPINRCGLCPVCWQVVGSLPEAISRHARPDQCSAVAGLHRGQLLEAPRAELEPDALRRQQRVKSVTLP
jgi:hypothetical protein